MRKFVIGLLIVGGVIAAIAMVMKRRSGSSADDWDAFVEESPARASTVSETARDQAAKVSQTAKDAASKVVDATKDAASKVVGATKDAASTASDSTKTA